MYCYRRYVRCRLTSQSVNATDVLALSIAVANLVGAVQAGATSRAIWWKRPRAKAPSRHQTRRLSPKRGGRQIRRKCRSCSGCVSASAALQLLPQLQKATSQSLCCSRSCGRQ